MEKEEGPPPTRWEVELEFVQGLANPMYVHFLAQQKYLEKPEFLRYLEYLEYWRHAPHVQFVAYPNCLLMLTLLKEPLFRQEIAKVEVAQLMMDGFFRSWQTAAAPEQPPAPESDASRRPPEAQSDGAPVPAADPAPAGVP